MKWAILLTSILAGVMSMEVTPGASDDNGLGAKTRVSRIPAFSEISCTRFVKSALVHVTWKGVTQIPGPYELFIYYNAGGGLYGLVQRVNLVDFSDHKVRFTVSWEWKNHCEKDVYFELRGNGKKICTYGTTTLATFCTNIIQKDDKNPDDTDMLFRVPGAKRTLTC